MLKLKWNIMRHQNILVTSNNNVKCYTTNCFPGQARCLAVSVYTFFFLEATWLRAQPQKLLIFFTILELKVA